MRQHFEIDMLSEYGVEDLPDTEIVVNPIWREMNRSRNQLTGKLRYRRAGFTALDMHPESEEDLEKYKKWIEKKATLLEDIEHFEKKLEGVKTEIKDVPKHVEMGDLDEKDRFRGLRSGRKRLLDTIKMVAYRSETTMVTMLTNPTVDSAKARRILQDLFISDADIIPEYDDKILRIRVHNASLPATNRSLAIMLEELNKTKTKYPGTEMIIAYELVK
jgi:predicted nuclease with TOPRIM domain